MMDSQDDNELKVILLGEAGVGKTNLINISTGGQFNENEQSSSNSTFSMKKLTVKGKSYAIKLWDTIGQEKLRHLTKLFYNDSKIVIFVYDKANKKSYEALNYWNDEIDTVLGDDVKFIKAVVGNKEDLDEEEVDENEAREFAKSIKAKFTMASAKKNGKRFINFLEELLGDYISKNKDKLNKGKDKLILDKDSQRKNVKDKNCCK